MTSAGADQAAFDRAQELDRAIDKIAARFPQSYGGTWGESDGTENVYVVRSGLKEFADALEAAAGPREGGYRVIPVARALSELDALRDKITEEADAIEAAGIELVSWGPEPRSNTVRVEVLGDPSAARDYLEKRFGRGLFTVVHTAYRMTTL